MAREPRPYQIQAIQNFDDARARGLRRLMLVLATGLGKTFTFSLIVKQMLDQGARVLVIAHREELILQAVGSISEIVPRGQIGVVAGRYRESHYPCVVGSVASLATDKQRANLPKFDLIVIDEAHRTLARSYRAIIDGLLSEKGVVLGVTATPQRGDGKALGEVYEEIIFQMGLAEGIAQGYLCNLRAVRVVTKADLSNLKVKATTDGDRDFAAKEVCGAMSKTNWKEEITKAWLRYASDRKTIGFLPSVAFAHELAEYMREQGIKAVAVDGKTDKTERRQMLRGFGTDYQVLLNCALLTEGVDLPDCDAILSAAMTASLSRYMQSIGRGTRNAPGKKDCLILDVVGVSKKNRIQEAFNLGALKTCVHCLIQSTLQYRQVGRYISTGAPAHVCADCFTQITCEKCERRGLPKYYLQSDEKHFHCDDCRIKAEAAARAAAGRKAANVIIDYKDADLLAERKAGDGRSGRFEGDDRRRIGRYEWDVSPDDEVMTIRISPDRYLCIERRETMDGIRYYYCDSIPGSDFKGVCHDRAEALRICEQEIVDSGSTLIAVSPDAATDKQVAYLRQLGAGNIPDGLTKKAAGAWIDRLQKQARGAAVGATHVGTN